MQTEYHEQDAKAFFALSAANKFVLKPQNKHIWEAMRRLKHQQLPSIRVELKTVAGGIAQKKAHSFAKAHEMDIRTKVRDGWLHILRLD